MQINLNDIPMTSDEREVFIKAYGYLVARGPHSPLHQAIFAQFEAMIVPAQEMFQKTAVTNEQLWESERQRLTLGLIQHLRKTPKQFIQEKVLN